MLNALGITTCRDLYEQRATLLLLFSKVSSQFFLQICLGVGSSDIHQFVYVTFTLRLHFFVACIVDLQSIICCCNYLLLYYIAVLLLLLCCCCCRAYERKSISTERYTVAFCDILLVQCVTKRLWLLVHVGWQQAVIVHNYLLFLIACLLVRKA